MENQYKVELWIDEITSKLNDVNTLRFNHNDENVLHIINDNYVDIFNCLLKNKAIRIANLKFDKNNFYQVYEEQKHQLNDKLSIFTSLNKEDQNKKLKFFKKEQEDYINKHSLSLYYIAFGFLDYYALDNKHTALSAPLVFVPIEIIYNEKDAFYQIKSLNNEVLLNEQLITYIRKTKKIDISYPLDERFDLDEYLLFVASRVHMFHYSTNNGVCISKFDIYKQAFLNDVLEHQNEISNHVLVKSIAYYNAEFYNFSKINAAKLNKKLLSLLALDNDEYRILKHIADRESLFLRSNNLKNKSHLINNIITSFLLNNKKVLIVYDDKKIKDEVYQNLDSYLIPYTFDLNEISSNKNELLDHLNQYDNNFINNTSFDPIASSEIINKYYNTRNNFKNIINELRIKRENVNLSLNECLEHFYRLDCPLIKQEITNIGDYNLQVLENNAHAIKIFENSLRKLKCYYKNHAFYGFEKKIMMQEDYLPLKKSVENLTKNLKLIQRCLKTLEIKYKFPLLNNLKQIKAMLNIFSILDYYINYSSYFEKKYIDNLKEKLIAIEKQYDEYIVLKKDLISSHGENILELNNKLNDIYEHKKVSRKDLNKYKVFFNENIVITKELLKEVDAKLKYLFELNGKLEILKGDIDNELNNYFIDGKYDLTKVNEIEEKVKFFENAQEYLMTCSLNIKTEDLNQFKDDGKYASLNAFKLRLQILFNRVLKNAKVLQEYFDVNTIDFSTLTLDKFFEKVSLMETSFESINDYLEFYFNLHKLNKAISNFAFNLLEEEDFTLYESMFYKRFYFDYSMYLLKNAKIKTINEENIIDSVNAYNISEENRKEIIERLLKNYHNDYIRSNISNLKRYEFDFIKTEKEKEFIKPLAKITYLAHESTYHMIPCIFTPLKSVAKILKNNQYHYDVGIFLTNDKVKTLDVLPCLHRVDQIIAFDDEYINNSFNEKIDNSNTEFFLSSCLNIYEKINFASKTYDVLKFKGNTLNHYFKNYLQNFLETSGFKVARDVPFKDGYLDFLVKMNNNSKASAIIVDRLPYYSLESAKVTFDAEQKELEGIYPLIRIFPFAFLTNEKDEQEKLITQIVDNATKNDIAEIKVVEKKLTDVIFVQYKNPYEVYYQNKARYVFDREKLFLEVLYNCAPIEKKVMLHIFEHDGVALLNKLLKNKIVKVKNDFIYVINQEIIFKSYKNKEQIRYVTSLSKEEVEDGVLTIVKNTDKIDEEMTIKMILIALGYKKMNARIYEYVHQIIISMVHNKLLTMHESSLSLYEEKIEDTPVFNEQLLKREN